MYVVLEERGSCLVQIQYQQVYEFFFFPMAMVTQGSLYEMFIELIESRGIPKSHQFWLRPSSYGIWWVNLWEVPSPIFQGS